MVDARALSVVPGTKVMKIGILEAGHVPLPLRAKFGSYAGMLRELFGPAYEYEDIDVTQPQFAREEAQRLRSCNAYLITGSAAGVHDGHDWIASLKAFVQEIAGRAPMIGICFGHQIMAEAFGGKVAKAPQGWGIGLHTYQILARAEWMRGDGTHEEADTVSSIAVPVSHQDQVIEMPPDAVLLAGSATTPYGVLSYPQRLALSLQCHPEFSPEYAASLIDLRRGSVYADSAAAEAIASLRATNDRARVAAWMRRFLRLAERSVHLLA